MGEAGHVWGQEGRGTSLYLLLGFAVNLKLLVKIKSLKNKNTTMY